MECGGNSHLLMPKNETKHQGVNKDHDIVNI